MPAADLLRCPRCPVRLDPALAKAGFTAHSEHWPDPGPAPRRNAPAGLRPAAPARPEPTIAEWCDVEACKHNAAAPRMRARLLRHYPGHGCYCARHARMLIPARQWAACGVPADGDGDEEAA